MYNSELIKMFQKYITTFLIIVESKFHKKFVDFNQYRVKKG